MSWLFPSPSPTTSLYSQGDNVNKHIPYSYKIYGNNTGWSHPSVKHGWHFLRVLVHILMGRVSFHVSMENVSRVWSVKVGPGAGYVTGLTAYLGLRCKDQSPGGNIYKRRFIQAGITRNANRVPYAA